MNRINSCHTEEKPMDLKASQTNTMEEVNESDLKQINEETKSLEKLKDSF